MGTIIVAGAGSTLAEALPSKPPFRERPPLDSTFFALCKRASLPELPQVRDYMLHRYGLNALDGTQRMEEVFNQIYSDAMQYDRATDRAVATYGVLVRLYMRAIARTANHLVGKSRSGVRAILRHLWRQKPSRDVSIVTFNQDLVIEKSLEYCRLMPRYNDIPWNIRMTYAIPFKCALFPKCPCLLR